MTDVLTAVDVPVVPVVASVSAVAADVSDLRKLNAVVDSLIVNPLIFS